LPLPSAIEIMKKRGKEEGVGGTEASEGMGCTVRGELVMTDWRRDDQVGAIT